MSIASSISGTVDEAVVFRQGVSVVTMPHQLQGMLPKMSAGTRARLVVSGNAPDSDVYFDDSMMGLGPGTITPDDPKINPTYFFVEEEDKFIEQYDLGDMGINRLIVTGAYEGIEDATYRIQIADPEDEDVYQLGRPTFNAILAVGETELDHLNDLSVILEDYTETTSTGDEKLLIASSSYDAAQGISTYKIEIASADDGSADRIVWYKNDELLSDSQDGEVINTDSGNVLEDGENRIAVRFEYDGYEDFHHGVKKKHTAGDYWTIIAGAQQFKWKKGKFDDSLGIDFDPPTERLIASGSGPIGILPSSMGLQYLHEGIYIQFPSQIGYSDGTNPNVEQNIWEFSVVAKKVEAAITAMQEAQGKIEYLPDHRMEQRDFGQPKFHKDFDIMTIEQQQVASVELKVASKIGTIPYIGEDRQLYTSIDGKKKNYSGADVGFIPDDLEAFTMSKDLYGFKLWSDGADVFTLVDKFSNISIYSTSKEILKILNDAGYVDQEDWASDNAYSASPLSERDWVAQYGFIPAVGEKSYDGKVGPYFTLYDLHPKCKTYRNNHIWYNFGNTTTDDLARYDDRDPKPQLSDQCMVDISGRELVDITVSDSMTETTDGLYEIYNVDVLHELPDTDPRRTDGTLGAAASVHPFGAGPDGWTNDEGETLTSASVAGFTADYDSNSDGTLDKMSKDSSGVEFWTKDEGETLVASIAVGWNPDTTVFVDHDDDPATPDEEVPAMSVNISGNVILEDDGFGSLVESPKNEEAWMSLHGYNRHYLDENEWMTREGYKAVEDLLHGKHFTLYDQRFAGYFVWFDVDDKGVNVADPTNAYSPGINNRPTIETSVYMHDPDETDDVDVYIHKSRSRYQEIRVRIKRSDKAKDIAQKLLQRINRKIPTAWLSPYHHFCIGADVRDTYKAIPDDNDNTVVQIEVRKSGYVFEPDFGDKTVRTPPGPDTSITINNEMPEGFQAFLRTYGGLAYNEYVLDDSITSEGTIGDVSSSKKVKRVGKFIKLYNSTQYFYPMDGTSHPAWVDDDHRYWSNDEGQTIIQFDPGTPFRFDLGPGEVICECVEGEWVETIIPPEEPDWWSLSESEWATLGGYLPYAMVDPHQPHIIWFNVDGICKNPAAISDDGSTRYAELWSYDVGSFDEADLYDANDYGRSLEVRLSSRSIDRNVAYRIKSAINNSRQFRVPFMASTPGNQEILRIQQRDPGTILNADGEQIDSFDECNSPTSHKVQLRGTLIPDLDRDYVADSMLFSFNDSSLIAQRFNAEKRVVEHYATYDIKCVAEQKDGYLFNYSNVEEWTDAEGFAHPGGKVEKSNYEWGSELEGIPQAVNSASELLWKTPLESDVSVTAVEIGFLPNHDSGSGINDQMTVDLKGRKIWIKNDPDSLGNPLSGALPLTAHSIGRSDIEMEDETVAGIPDYIEYPVFESEWMVHEGYEAVPAFSHIASQASYVFLPHPELNYYIWFDVASISSDPGDDGKLDHIMGHLSETSTNPESYVDSSRVGGAVRVGIDSYDTAGVVAEKLAKRINDTCYDVAKKYARVGIADSTGDGIKDSYAYRAINAGNINHHFYAEVLKDDSSTVRVYCRQPGLVSYTVLEENQNISIEKFPETTSGDKMSFTLIDDGDSEYFVDIENIVPGTIYPPESDVGKPDVDTGLFIDVTEKPYSPTQPGATKVVSKLIPYEDMMSIDRGYLEVQEDGTEIAKSGPVAYIEDDIGMLIYPIIMSNVSMKDPDQYDGAIEPLEIRSRASRNSPDGYFVAHDVKGMVMTEMAEDSRKRSNPITQFIENPYMVKDEFNPGTMVIGNRLDPYEDGVEHMASSPAVASFTRTPVFDGIGVDDLHVTGSYRGETGSGAVKYYVKVSDVGSVDASGNIYHDKMKWKKDDQPWSESIELDDTGYVEKKIIMTFNNLGGEQAIPSLSTANPSGPDAMYSITQELLIPESALSMDLSIHCKGDINQQNEFYRIEWYDEVEEEWIAIADYSNIVRGDGVDQVADTGRGYSPNIENGLGYSESGLVGAETTWEDYTRFNDPYHPEYGTDSRNGYSISPHGEKGWNGDTTLDPNADHYTSTRYTEYSKMKFRVMASAFVDADSPYKNAVKLVFKFRTRAAQLEIEEGLTAVFETSFGHTAGDIWSFEAIAKSHEDNVGSAVLPGYLTWQESKMSPFIESAEKEQDIIEINDPTRINKIATGSLVFNFPGNPDSSLDAENDYIDSLNAQAFSLSDVFGTSLRFEFDDDGEIENDGELMVPLLRPETYFLRFPMFDTIIHKRAPDGRLLWTDGLHGEFTSGGKTQALTAHPAFENSSMPLTNDEGVVTLSSAYIPYDRASDGDETNWVNEYGFAPVYVLPEEINGGLKSAADYAGTYFVITNQLKKPYAKENEQDLRSNSGILNTVTGRRYAVWFNVVTTDESGSEVPLAGSTPPDFEDLGRWTVDEGYTLLNPGAIGYVIDDGVIESSEIAYGYGVGVTGYSPDTDTVGDGKFDKMAVTLGGETIWTFDGVNVTTARLAGYTGFYDALSDDLDTTCVEDDTVPTAWSEEEWAAANGYTLKPLTEEEWHTAAVACTLRSDNTRYEPGDELQEPYSDYRDMKPELIEVKIKDVDSSRKMTAKLVKSLRQFRNANSSKSFITNYISPPEYEDFWDIMLDDPIPDPDDTPFVRAIYPTTGYVHTSFGTIMAPPTPGFEKWVVADYDPEKLVRIDHDWFSQYALDPNSPPNKLASEAGWIPGYHTIKVESMNPGYHIVRAKETIRPLQPWEPGFENISRKQEYIDTHICTDFDATPPSTFLGGALLEIAPLMPGGLGGYSGAGPHPCVEAGAGNPIEYTAQLGALRAFEFNHSTDYTVREFAGEECNELSGGHKTLEALLIDTNDIINNSTLDIKSTVVYDKNLGTTGIGLYDHIFLTGKTLLDTTSYKFIDGRPGLLLYQNQPGEEGNTLVKFHHYNESLSGNIVSQNFKNGYDAGPYVSDSVAKMNMSTEKMRPNRHKSSTAGLVFENNPSGTDSIAFGGWKK